MKQSLPSRDTHRACQELENKAKLNMKMKKTERDDLWFLLMELRAQETKTAVDHYIEEYIEDNYVQGV